MTNANQTANSNTQNTDPAELQKFAAMAAKWWDATGDMRPLHDINPLRLDWIAQHAPPHASTFLDVGCGGGLVAEGLAQRFPNAAVQGIDMADKVLSVARLKRLGGSYKIRQLFKSCLIYKSIFYVISSS